MPFDVSIKSDLKQFKRKLTSLERDAYPKAVVRTLNRVGGSARTASAKHIAPLMESRQGDVKRRIRQEKATKRRLWSTLIASGRPLRLMAFKARQTASGVKAKAWGQTKIYKHTFIAPFKAGGKAKKGVFVRKGKARLPIKQLWGPGVTQLFKQKENDTVMERTVRERFAKEFRANLNYYVSRLKKRR
nr:hypothetical protein 20 [bacterium]